jgi:phenylpropionate dioxygenase-like ring-hydroxylating dioxygenase large terminal subunit
MVFAFLGDLPEAERPPLLEVDLLDDDSWRLSGPLVFEIDAYYQRSIENGMDPTHNEFVHPSQGAPAIDEERFSVIQENWGCEFMVNFGELTDAESHDKVVERDATGDLSAGSQHLGPNHMLTIINIPGGFCFRQYFYEAPLSAKRTRIFFINNRNNSLDAKLDDVLNGQFMKVANEDRVVIEGLYPKRTPDTLTKELMTAGDAAVVKYREYLAKWDKNGWAIDMNKLRETDGDVAYAIPCPARRESGNWILDTIPLLPAAT